MTKQENIDKPNSCWNKARLTEQIFVLLQRDRAMPHALREWAAKRVQLRLNNWTDGQIEEALTLATAIEAYHAANSKSAFDGTYLADNLDCKVADNKERGKGF